MHHHSSPDSSPLERSAQRRGLIVACAITLGIVAVQGVGAVMTGSLALLTDMVHSLTDSVGLIVAVIAASLMYSRATSRRTWGLRRMEVLAGLMQAALLAGIGIYAGIEGIQRLSDPVDVDHLPLAVFGALGLAGNIASLMVLRAHRHSNFNLRAAFLEVLADALGSVAVLVAAASIWLTGWAQADAVAALLIAALIVPRAVVLLVETSRVLLELTPRGVDLEAVREHLRGVRHVEDVHDLHASTVATGLPIISAHVVLDEACFNQNCAPEVLADLRECVAEHFDVSIEHSTFQLETRELAGAERHSHR